VTFCRSVRVFVAPWGKLFLSKRRSDSATIIDRFMDPSQTEAVNRAFEILGEHFDHVVIAVGTYDEDKQYTTSASYTGGVAAAVGLCRLYETKWMDEHLWGGGEDTEME